MFKDGGEDGECLVEAFSSSSRFCLSCRLSIGVRARQTSTLAEKMADLLAECDVRPLPRLVYVVLERSGTVAWFEWPF